MPVTPVGYLVDRPARLRTALAALPAWITWVQDIAPAAVPAEQIHIFQVPAAEPAPPMPLAVIDWSAECRRERIDMDAGGAGLSGSLLLYLRAQTTSPSGTDLDELTTFSNRASEIIDALLAIPPNTLRLFIVGVDVLEGPTRVAQDRRKYDGDLIEIAFALSLKEWDA